MAHHSGLETPVDRSRLHCCLRVSNQPICIYGVEAFNRGDTDWPSFNLFAVSISVAVYLFSSNINLPVSKMGLFEIDKMDLLA